MTCGENPTTLPKIDPTHAWPCPKTQQQPQGATTLLCVVYETHEQLERDNNDDDEDDDDEDDGDDDEDDDDVSRPRDPAQIAFQPHLTEHLLDHEAKPQHGE